MADVRGDWIPDGSLEFLVHPRTDVARIDVMGDLDLVNVARFEAVVAAVAGPGITHVQIDASAIRFVDSSGIRGFVSAKRHLPAGTELVVLRASPAVRAAFRICGLEELLDPDDSTGSTEPAAADDLDLTIDLTVDPPDPYAVGAAAAHPTIISGSPRW